MTTPAKVLTIGGSDSGGAAGLQADLKTLTMLGVYGLTVVTAVTAQNSQRVVGLHSIPSSFVADQIDAVLSDYGAAAVKTGFLGRVDLIEVVAGRMKDHRPGHLVIDPVLVDHRRRAMFAPAVSQAYIDHLFPIADLVTPNLAEASLLTGYQPDETGSMRKAARALRDMGPGHVLLTGGHRGDQMVDLFFDGQDFLELRAPWVNTEHTHGSGDTLSAAASAYLSLGRSMSLAVQLAHAFATEAIRRGAAWEMGAGHGPVGHF